MEPGTWDTMMNGLSGAATDIKASPWIKDPNNLAMLLGTAGQAFSANDPTSWQNQMGGLASGMGQMGKMSKAGAKVSQQQDMFTKALAALSGGMTPQGMPGGTSFKMGKDGDFTIGGMMPQDKGGLKPFSPDPELAPGFDDATKGLAGFRPSSSSLSADDLLGLSSQEIGGLLSQQLAGGNQGLDLAKFKYEMGKPKGGNIVEGIDDTFLVGPDGSKTSLGITPYRKPTDGKSHDVSYWDASGTKHTVTTTDPNSIRRSVEDQGGTFTDPGDVTQKEKSAEDLAKRHTSALIGIAEDHVAPKAQILVEEANRTSPDDATEAHIWVPRTIMTRASKEGAQKIKLPVINGRQLTMRDLRRSLGTMKGGKTIQDAIVAAFEKAKPKEDTTNPLTNFDSGQI